MKIGDKVIVTKNHERRGLNSIKGLKGKIVEINDNQIGIQFEEKIENGHSCSGYGRAKGRTGYCWYIPPSHIKPAKITNWRKVLDG